MSTAIVRTPQLLDNALQAITESRFDTATSLAHEVVCRWYDQDAGVNTSRLHTTRGQLKDAVQLLSWAQQEAFESLMAAHAYRPV